MTQIESLYVFQDEKTALFQDPTFAYANKFKLSTSQVPIHLKQSYMGYGAVVPDGYGVSYNLQDDHIIFAICSYFSCETTNSRRFTKALVQSLMELKDLFKKEEFIGKSESKKEESNGKNESKKEEFIDKK